MTKFRVNDHELNIEKGRYIGIQRESRHCTVRNWRAIETEEHFLFDCPLYENLQTKLLSVTGDLKFNYLSRNALFKYLFTNDKKQSTIHVEVAEYVHKAFQDRYLVSTFHFNHFCSPHSALI